MKPELFRFEVPWVHWPVTIYSLGTVIVIAFLVSSWWVGRRAHRTLGVDKDRAFNVTFALFFLGLAGARLLYALVHYAKFTSQPGLVFKVWEGGFALYGGLIGGLLWLAWYLPRHPDLKGFAFLDVLALGTCLALFLGRFASILSGQDFGKPTTLPWGVPVTGDANPALDAVRKAGRNVLETRLHPVAIYESLFALLLFFVLRALLPRLRAGRAAALFLMAYAVGRSALELLRWDDAERGMIVPGLLSVPQFLSIPLFFAGFAIWLIRRPTDRPVPRPAPAHPR